MKKLFNAKLDEIKAGYTYDKEAGVYECLICNDKFEDGEIYQFDGRFFEASKAVSLHIKAKHKSALEILLSLDKKSTGITDNQKELLANFAQGLSDNEIARKSGLAPATIRHQRFMFREKAKQAKLYLSIFELVEASMSKEKNSEFVEVHNSATQVDERYAVTAEEQEKIIKTYFASLEPLKLKTFPTKEKRKIVVLRKILTLFDLNKKYPEKEVNSILKEVFPDFATIRRYLIEYGFMERTNDCSQYWRKV